MFATTIFAQPSIKLPRESLTLGHGLIGIQRWVGIRHRRLQFGSLFRWLTKMDGHRSRTSNAGEGNHAQNFDLKNQRRLATENWLQVREGEATKLDLEEVRRRASEAWRNKYAK